MSDLPSSYRDLRPRRTTFEWIAWFVSLVIGVGVVIWAWNASEVRPGVLISNADRAVTYVFGRTLSDAERAEVRRQAERLVDLRIRTDAEVAVRKNLDLAANAEVPADFEDRVERTIEQEMADLGPAGIAARIDRESARIMLDKRGGYLPPETRWGRLREYGAALLETIAMAVMGTLFCVIAAIPLSLFAAHTSLRVLIPGDAPVRRGIRTTIHFVFRRLFDVCRGFNEFVLALILVAIIGLGPFAGVLALAFHSTGVLGKVVADALETIAPGEVEGVTATGARPSQVISFAVFPQIMPFIVSQALLRFETNVRSASVLGLVGAGGVGFLIDAKMSAYQYREVATIMIMIIVVVSAIDWSCGRVMKRWM